MKTALTEEAKVLSGTLQRDTEVIRHGQEQQRQLLDNGNITEEMLGLNSESHIPYCIIQLNYFKFQSYLMLAGIYW